MRVELSLPSSAPFHFGGLIVANPNKRKGDAAERKVRDFLVCAGFSAFKTRAGWDDDRGDVIVPLRSSQPGGMAVQVKDVASPRWSEWLRQLTDQVRNGGHHHGVLWWKRRGISDPGQWLVIMRGHEFLTILEELGYPRETTDTDDEEG